MPDLRLENFQGFLSQRTSERLFEGLLFGPQWRLAAHVWNDVVLGLDDVEVTAGSAHHRVRIRNLLAVLDHCPVLLVEQEAELLVGQTSVWLCLDEPTWEALDAEEPSVLAQQTRVRLVSSPHPGRPALEVARLRWNPGPVLDRSWWPETLLVSQDFRSRQAFAELVMAVRDLPPELVLLLARPDRLTWRQVAKELGQLIRQRSLGVRELNAELARIQVAASDADLAGWLRDLLVHESPGLPARFEWGNRTWNHVAELERTSLTREAAGVRGVERSTLAPIQSDGLHLVLALRPLTTDGECMVRVQTPQGMYEKLARADGRPAVFVRLQPGAETVVTVRGAEIGALGGFRPQEGARLREPDERKEARSR